MHKRFEKYYDSYYADQHDAKVKFRAPFNKVDAEYMMYKAWMAGRKYGKQESIDMHTSWIIQWSVLDENRELVDKISNDALEQLRTYLTTRVPEMRHEFESS